MRGIGDKSCHTHLTEDILTSGLYMYERECTSCAQITYHEKGYHEVKYELNHCHSDEQFVDVLFWCVQTNRTAVPQIIYDA